MATPSTWLSRRWEARSGGPIEPAGTSPSIIADSIQYYSQWLGQTFVLRDTLYLLVYYVPHVSLIIVLLVAFVIAWNAAGRAFGVHV
mmetsp:Transcript_7211/g.14748  ORF Transcript_7211/g.14748 Transcript_7211/m.14748 type:complete len:87 (-) Transcript_7211:76-336(-)